jgi:hypothetical protein
MRNHVTLAKSFHPRLAVGIKMLALNQAAGRIYLFFRLGTSENLLPGNPLCHSLEER